MTDNCNLSRFAQDISISIAMTADICSVGVDGYESYDEWVEKLYQAVDDGLEEAERRAANTIWRTDE